MSDTLVDDLLCSPESDTDFVVVEEGDVPLSFEAYVQQVLKFDHERAFAAAV